MIDAKLGDVADPRGGESPDLSPAVRALLEEGRRAVLVTRREARPPRVMPVCYAVVGDALVTPIDEKPKRVSDPMRLGRVLDVVAAPEVVVLVDRWSEDWRHLAWARVEGSAEVLRRGDALPPAVAELRRRYPQYRSMALESLPLIRITPARVTTWGDLPDDSR